MLQTSDIQVGFLHQSQKDNMNIHAPHNFIVAGTQNTVTIHNEAPTNNYSFKFVIVGVLIIFWILGWFA